MHVGNFFSITGRDVSQSGILYLKANSSLGDWVHSVRSSGDCDGNVSDGGSLANLYSNGYCNNAIIQSNIVIKIINL